MPGRVCGDLIVAPVQFHRNTQIILEGLASLAPATLAVMHGSSFFGNCNRALLDLATVMKEVLDQPSYTFPTEKTPPKDLKGPSY
jgi:hypothetical protein